MNDNFLVQPRRNSIESGFGSQNESAELSMHAVASQSDATIDNNEAVFSAFRPNADNKVNFVITAGERVDSQLIYSKDEEQFYKKNKLLKSGLIMSVCRYAGCNNKVYLNPVTNECTYQKPYMPHNHSPKQKEYKRLFELNKMKKSCSDPIKISAKNTKTSAVKRIFEEVLEE